MSSFPDSLYAGLTVLEESKFPQSCSCNRSYADLGQFLKETTPVSGTSGLSDISWYQESSVVGVWRNCSCTSTMLILCSDRRDNSEAGQARRERFGERMKVLCENGITSHDARAFLLKHQGKTWA